MSNDSKTILLGAVASQLLANGYEPVSATTGGAYSHRTVDDPAAVLCDTRDDKRSIISISVCVADAKVRAAVRAIVHAHVGAKGPVCIHSDGSETFIARPRHDVLPQSGVSERFDKELLPALAIDGRRGRPNEKGEFPPRPFFPLSAPSWRNGDLCIVARDALPVLSDQDKLVAEVRTVLDTHKPEVEYVIPTRVLTAEQKAARAEADRLDAELAKRNDPEILSEVELRVQHLSRSSFGSHAYERLINQQRAQSPESRISIYDQILKERAEEARRKSRRRSA